MSEHRPIRFILDTDIGDNVDDALALGLACRSPELRVLGVTTVFRDPWRRAAIAMAVLDAFGHGDVPVAAGIGKPLLGPWDQRPPRHYDMDYSNFLRKLDRRHAVQLIIETAFEEARPAPSLTTQRLVEQPLRDRVEQPLRDLIEPITVCCTGPLTNLAVALATEPTLAERIRVVLMGGMITGQRIETNVSADPEAARIVFSSGAEVTMVGLDVTLGCVLTTAQVDCIRASEHRSAQLLAHMIAAWMRDSDRPPTLHDPLAVAMSFDTSFCKLEPMAVTVETAGERTRGMTVARADGSSSTQVCTAVDAARFVQLFLERVCSSPGKTY